MRKQTILRDLTADGNHSLNPAHARARQLIARTFMQPGVPREGCRGRTVVGVLRDVGLLLPYADALCSELGADLQAQLVRGSPVREDEVKFIRWLRSQYHLAMALDRVLGLRLWPSSGSSSNSRGLRTTG